MIDGLPPMHCIVSMSLHMPWARYFPQVTDRHVVLESVEYTACYFMCVLHNYADYLINPSFGLLRDPLFTFSSGFLLAIFLEKPSSF